MTLLCDVFWNLKAKWLGCCSSGISDPTLSFFTYLIGHESQRGRSRCAFGRSRGLPETDPRKFGHSAVA